MGKIFCIFGKSATGKDTLYHELINDSELGLKSVVLYTTRPKRVGEIDGKHYHFVSEEHMKTMDENGSIIEHRVYNTVFGPWHYFTADDGSIQLDKENYLIIGTLDAFCSIRDYFGNDLVVPLYIFVEDGLRLTRAIEREKVQQNPAYDEVCRRFLADCEDFSQDKLDRALVDKKYENNEFQDCLEELKAEIRKNCK